MAVDMVNHPPHYNFATLEPIDVILGNKMGFCLGNALKYVARCQLKGSTRQDLDKAIWYLCKSAFENFTPPDSWQINYCLEDVLSDWNIALTSPKGRMLDIIMTIHTGEELKEEAVGAFKRAADELCTSL